MIGEALTLLKGELKHYLVQKGDNTDVVIDNIALWDTQNGAAVENKIVMTNVNIEEESSLKNRPHFKKGLSGNIDYTEPPVHLNLYILFCANYTGSENSYFYAQRRLSYIISFFQSEKCFTLSNSPHADIIPELKMPGVSPDLECMRLNLELYTLTFEQINHLWGSLGGKQVPFVMYKCRLVTIAEPAQQGGSVIKEIHNGFEHAIES